jgi:hypothetical protein
MDLDFLDLGPAAIYQLGSVAAIGLLLFILVASFMSRSKVFCQYLKHMTGIRLKPSMVLHLYKKGGKSAVRDHLIDLLIREDLADTSRIVTPDSKPDLSIFTNVK